MKRIIVAAIVAVGLLLPHAGRGQDISHTVRERYIFELQQKLARLPSSLQHNGYLLGRLFRVGTYASVPLRDGGKVFVFVTPPGGGRSCFVSFWRYDARGYGRAMAADCDGVVWPRTSPDEFHATLLAVLGALPQEPATE